MARQPNIHSSFHTRISKTGSHLNPRFFAEYIRHLIQQQSITIAGEKNRVLPSSQLSSIGEKILPNGLNDIL
jgi:hypothetical protein